MSALTEDISDVGSDKQRADALEEIPFLRKEQNMLKEKPTSETASNKNISNVSNDNRKAVLSSKTLDSIKDIPSTTREDLNDTNNGNNENLDSTENQSNVENVRFNYKNYTTIIKARGRDDSEEDDSEKESSIEANPEGHSKKKKKRKRKKYIVIKAEGQRKALFEECEYDKNKNGEEILRLKKEVSELVIKLKGDRSLSAKDRIQCSQLEDVIGYVGDKTCSEATEVLDLQIIDKSKQLDLLRYQTRKKEECLKKLADEYQTLISGKLEKFTKNKIENPMKKTIQDLQNSIHAVQVQWREAEHVRIRYREIKNSLQEDAARFENSIDRTKLQLQTQQVDIERLQQINSEANRMRGIARNILLQEEKGAVKSAATRERQAAEGKRLIVERRQELEKLEKKIFQTGKAPIRPETEGDESNAQTPTPPLYPKEDMDSFETLKEATGGNTIDEVLERFFVQKDTSGRLSQLRASGEDLKGKLEKKFDNLTAQLESLKFAEVKEAEESAEELEALKVSIDKEKETIHTHIQSEQKHAEIIAIVLAHIQTIFCNINPLTDTEKEPLVVLGDFRIELENIMNEYQKLENEKKDIEEPDIIEEKILLPPPYSGLTRKTPVPQQGPSVTPDKGSDEEEEVPSRGYLKRQAQIVIDAKSRRKSMRFPMKK